MCEGTRFTQEKYLASVEVAKQKGLPILKHHLLPRTKGFTLVASQIKGKIDYIYDITLGVNDINGSKPSLMHLLNGLPARFEIVLRRLPVKDIPVEDEKLCAEYLQKLYKEKVNFSNYK
jgi:lysophosphatidic acid acyltransferase / lysophosphatidylinositol acyltransferase